MDDAKLLRYLRPPQVGSFATSGVSSGANEFTVSSSTTTIADAAESRRIWIVDRELGYRLCQIIDDDDTKKQNQLINVEYTDERGQLYQKLVNESDTQPLNPSAFDLCEDMASLTHLNDASVLHNLRRRFSLRLIHTFSGLFCVTLNPWEWLPIYTQQIMQLYNGVQQQNPPPHIFSIAQAAYSGILSGGGDQSILITGESGAGKTENTKKIIQYLTSIATISSSRTPSTLMTQSTYGKNTMASTLEEQIIEMNPVLESFGNAKTTRNDNSSRFGKFIRIRFGGSRGHVNGAQVESYLLEKSRVVSQNIGERNFHIFYQLLSNGTSRSLRNTLHLRGTAESYRYLCQGGGTDVLRMINDEHDAQHTDLALDTLGFTADEKLSIYKLVASCILLGQLKFAERSGLDMSFIEDIDDAEKVSSLLGIKAGKLVDALSQPTIRIGEMLIRKNQTLNKTLFAVSAVTKSLYERTFKWIVDKCNQSLYNNSMNKKRQNRRSSVGCGNIDDVDNTQYIGVLDVAGFEILSMNSFEQFCINYTNERLQQFFNHFMFIREQTEYHKERIQWNTIDFGQDLQPTIDLIDRPLGILCLLDEECLVPKGNDDALLEKLCQTHHNVSPAFTRAKPSKKSTIIGHFSIAHYAGNVTYNIDGWVEKNRDPLNECLIAMLAESTSHIVRQLFPIQGANEIGKRKSMATFTVSNIYKDQLNNLLNTLNRTSAHFIRCIIPNLDRKPGIVNGPLVLHQLRCNGVLEGIRICRRGYPNRLIFRDFVSRYSLLVPSSSSSDNNDDDNQRKSAEQLCNRIGLVPITEYQLGVTKVFFRVGLIGELENRRNQRLAEFVTGIQAHIRSYLVSINYEYRYNRWQSMLIIQRSVRQFSNIINWRWYRLLLMVAQVIPRERKQQLIDALMIERDQLKQSVNRLEQQNNKLTVKIDAMQCELDTVNSEKRNKDLQLRTMENDMRQHEKLLSTIRENVDEQQAKIDNLHCTLKSEHNRLEQLQHDHRLLEDELASTRYHLEREKTIREQIEDDYEQSIEKAGQIDTQFRNAQFELDNIRNQLHIRTDEIDKLTAKTNEQSELIVELQKQICDQNSRVSQVESLLHVEKMSTKKAQNDRIRIDDELRATKMRLEKIEQKNDALKDELRSKDNEMQKIDKKMCKSAEQWEFCVADLKKRHSILHEQLQTQLEECRRKLIRFESENKQLKAIAMERETSIDSDYGGSLRSNRKLTTSLRKRVDVFSIESKIREEISSSLQKRFARSGSTNDVLGRKLEDIEKELKTAHTDNRLMKREIEVYKRTLNERDEEKDNLNKQLKSLVVDVDEMNKNLFNEEAKNAELQRKLRKCQNDVANWKRKYEESVQERDDELHRERKRMQTRIDEAMHDQQLRSSHVSVIQKSKEELHGELADVRLQLDRATTQISQMDKLAKSQNKMVDTWENQYRIASNEIEMLRDENAALKTKLRRQQREVDLLSKQSSIQDDVSVLETDIQRLRDELLSSSTHSQDLSPSTSSSSMYTRVSSTYGSGSNRYED